MIDLDGTPNKGRLGANAILGPRWRSRAPRPRRRASPCIATRAGPRRTCSPCR